MPSDLDCTELELDLVSNFDKPEDTWMSHDGKTIVVYTGRKAVASDGTTFTIKDLDDPEGTQCLTKSHYKLSLTPEEAQAIENHQECHSLHGDPNSKLNWALHNLRRARTREFVPSTAGPERCFERIATASKLDQVTSAATAALASLTQ